jgi:capsular exopolysaccharide synthesis family protein
MIFQVLVRGRKTILISTGSFFLLALLYGLFWPKTYQSVTTVKVPDNSQAAASASRDMAFSSTLGDPIETYVQVAEADKVVLGVIDTLNLRSKPDFKNVSEAKLIRNLKKQVIIDNVKNSNLISIAARDETPQAAATLANAWAQSFIQLNQDLNQEAAEARYKFLHKQLEKISAKISEDKENKRNFMNQSNELEADELVYKSLLEQDQESRIQANGQNPGIVVVDTGAIPDKPVSPKILIGLVLGTMAGLFFGVLIAFVRERLEDLVYETQDLSKIGGAGLWASILWENKKGLNPAPTGLMTSYSGTLPIGFPPSIKTLRATLLLTHPGAGSMVLGIYSPGRGEGRTLISANLALSLSQAGKKVLLIDADLGHPMVGSFFHLENPGVPGLARVISGQSSLKEALFPAKGLSNLTLLPTPPPAADLGGIFDVQSVKKIIGDLKQKYDFIIFDGTPLLVSPDSTVFATAMDGVICLARYGKTRRADIVKANQQLQAAHIPVWGTLLNGVALKALPWFGNKKRDGIQVS